MDDPRPNPRRRFAWAGGIAATALAGAVFALVLLNDRAGPEPDGEQGPDIGSCVETYSTATLPKRDFAFDGTVTGIHGDQVTLAINRSFQGAASGQVTLTAMGMTGSSVTSAGGPILTVGRRYLVAGDDVFAWPCGFTQSYDDAVAAAWAQALR